MSIQLKDIRGYEGLYKISETGYVQSFDRFVNRNGKMIVLKGRVLKNKITTHGYYYVSLTDKKGADKNWPIHRLIAIHFIPNPMNYNVVNHKNGNKLDNSIENLEWCTHKYNIQHSFKMGLTPPMPKNNPYSSRKIIQKTLTGEFIKEYPSMMQVKRELGFNVSNLTVGIKRRKGQAYGYLWSYAIDAKSISPVNTQP